MYKVPKAPKSQKWPKLPQILKNYNFFKNAIMESCFISKHNYTFLYTLVLTKFFLAHYMEAQGKFLR